MTSRFAQLRGPSFVLRALFFACLSASCARITSDLSSGLTDEGLLAIRPGMTRNEVLGLLGEPLERRPAVHWRSGENLPELQANCDDWIYARPNYSIGGFEVAVSFCGGSVVSAGGEYSDLGFYQCRVASCPKVLDAKTLHMLPSKRPL